MGMMEGWIYVRIQIMDLDIQNLESSTEGRCIGTKQTSNESLKDDQAQRLIKPKRMPGGLNTKNKLAA